MVPFALGMQTPAGVAASTPDRQQQQQSQQQNSVMTARAGWLLIPTEQVKVPSQTLPQAVCHLQQQDRMITTPAAASIHATASSPYRPALTKKRGASDDACYCSMLHTIVWCGCKIWPYKQLPSNPMYDLLALLVPPLRNIRKLRHR